MRQKRPPPPPKKKEKPTKTKCPMKRSDWSTGDIFLPPTEKENNNIDNGPLFVSLEMFQREKQIAGSGGGSAEFYRVFFFWF